jgi:hypothetical protein
LCQADVNAMSRWGSQGCGEKYGKSDLARVSAADLALNFQLHTFAYANTCRKTRLGINFV